MSSNSHTPAVPDLLVGHPDVIKQNVMHQAKERLSNFNTDCIDVIEEFLFSDRPPCDIRAAEMSSIADIICKMCVPKDKEDFKNYISSGSENAKRFLKSTN